MSVLKVIRSLIDDFSAGVDVLATKSVIRGLSLAARLGGRKALTKFRLTESQPSDTGFLPPNSQLKPATTTGEVLRLRTPQACMPAADPFMQADQPIDK